ncbi:MAG: outer membrane protein assembly factor BamD [Candidatus Marinimicrobia bacterium]|nr:outer membrane protein assembly factor BamD [Candidatus Neomarinimicrobiota bacterium]
MLKKSIIIFLSLILLISCGGPEKDADGYWESAGALADVGNYEGAVAQYKNILEYYPSDSLASKALLRIGEIKRSKTKKYEEAINTYQQYINKYPQSSSTPNALFMIAYVYANDMQNYEKAKSAYNKFIEKYPDHELVPSAKWELKNMGQDIQNIIQSEGITMDSIPAN